jgi:hypothetical protein
VTKGSLVRVALGRSANRRDQLGEVLDYRPDVRGGTHVQSYRVEWVWHQEIVTVPKRGDVLVLFYEDGDMSWIDELDVELVQG